MNNAKDCALSTVNHSEWQGIECNLLLNVLLYGNKKGRTVERVDQW